ncbi:MAG: hypothetical protein ACXIUM_06535 [Wenzhouxiangella sp.]
MATASAAQKLLLGQKMPQAWSRLKNRPLSRRMHREKCRPLVRLASGAPVFANGAVTAAMAYAFNQLASQGSEEGSQDKLSGICDQFDPEHPRFHIYPVENEACSMIAVMCTPDNVFHDGVRRNPVPFRGTFSDPVVTGQRAFIPTAGFVVFTVDEANLTLINMTEPLHTLHPGFVSRSVVVRDHRVYIQTLCEGAGFFGRANEFAGPHLFSRLDARIRRQFMGGN